MRRLLFIFAFMVLIAAMQAAHYYPRLPDMVASHFGAGGKSDGWMAKGSFVAFYLGTLAFIAGTFVLIQVLTGNLHRIPRSCINLPNKEYWLAPERIQESQARLSDCMETFSLWFGSATMAFIIGTYEFTFRANLQAEQVLPRSFLWLLGAYLTLILSFLIGWVRRVHRLFPKPPTTTT